MGKEEEDEEEDLFVFNDTTEKVHRVSRGSLSNFGTEIYLCMSRFRCTLATATCLLLLPASEIYLCMSRFRCTDISVYGDSENKIPGRDTLFSN